MIRLQFELQIVHSSQWTARNKAWILQLWLPSLFWLMSSDKGGIILEGVFKLIRISKKIKQNKRGQFFDSFFFFWSIWKHFEIPLCFKIITAIADEISKSMFNLVRRFKMNQNIAHTYSGSFFLIFQWNWKYLLSLCHLYYIPLWDKKKWKIFPFQSIFNI